MSSDLNLPICERVAWMQELHPVNAHEGRRYYFAGAMVNEHREQIANISLVADDSHVTQHWYYCGDDNQIFPVNGTCPTCGRGVRAEKPNAQPAQEGMFTAPKATI